MAVHVPAPENPSHARGFSLAETAGALLILAVAILGISALHLESKQINNALELHDQAVSLAEQMTNRIKSNPDPKARYETAVGIICKPSKVDAIRAPLMDVACWQLQVAEDLPSGTGRIVRDSEDSQTLYTIIVSWYEPERGTASYVARIGR
jgi:type IV pilus modification protein PilV